MYVLISLCCSIRVSTNVFISTELGFRIWMDIFVGYFSVSLDRYTKLFYTCLLPIYF